MWMILTCIFVFVLGTFIGSVLSLLLVSDTVKEIKDKNKAFRQSIRDEVQDAITKADAVEAQQNVDFSTLYMNEQQHWLWTRRYVNHLLRSNGLSDAMWLEESDIEEENTEQTETEEKE